MKDEGRGTRDAMPIVLMSPVSSGTNGRLSPAYGRTVVHRAILGSAAELPNEICGDHR